LSIRTIMVLLPAQGLRAFWEKGKRVFVPRIRPRQDIGTLVKNPRLSFRGRLKAGNHGPETLFGF
jgi:hypothetical protein